jgi:5'-nucleotidase
MEFDWDRAGNWVAHILADLVVRPIEAGLFYNVNLPHLGPSDDEPETVFCALDPHPLPLSYRHEEGGELFYDGVYRSRERTRGSDVDVCFGGRIAVTAIRLF